MNYPARKFATVMILAVAVFVVAAFAKEDPAVKSIELPDDHPVAKLKPGPGVDTVEANCMGCHSTDYIVRQPGANAQRWQDEVNKMIKTFGAPISDTDAKTIVNYLSTAYAPAKTPPAAEPGATVQTAKEKSRSH